MPTSEVEVLVHTSPQPLFLTTHWSVVLAAQDKNSPECARALETLCRTYWYPLYAFVRSSGYSSHDAEDLTQGFFAQLLVKDYLHVVRQERGPFRAFLKMALRRFLVHEWDRVRAQKRGGGQARLSLDTKMAEQRFQDERGATFDPDLIYDRRWALALLGEATARLEREYAGSGKAAEFRQLKPHLTAERGEIPYGEIAVALEINKAAARVAVHRLRKRFRDLFGQVIADTVSDAGEVEEELRHVINVLSRG